MIYLDSAATTKIHPAVKEAMELAEEAAFANPGSIHSAGWTAKKMVDQARAQVARVIGAAPQNIIFTSGGSEANSLALLGLIHYLRTLNKTRLLFGETEHKSVLRAAERLSEEGFFVGFLPVDETGAVPLSAVREALRPDTGLVSVMAVNNETGAAADLKSIGRYCRGHGVLFHTDCVQAYGKRALDTEEICADFLSVSAHKLHGPKGVGCLYVGYKSMLRPLVVGGSQEYGLRAGTENVPGIAGFGKAASLAREALEERKRRGLYSGRNSVRRIAREVLDRLPEISHVNGLPDPESGIVNLRFDRISGESLVLLCSSRGLMISAGSACTANSNQPSHVLKAMGLRDDEARGSVRLSCSDDLTEEEEKEAVEILVRSVKELTAVLS